MAPSATQTAETVITGQTGDVTAKKAATQDPSSQVKDSELKVEEEKLPELRTGHKEPLKLSGALDQYKSFDVTPVIGREYEDVNLVELLRAPNSDDLIRDLAITSESCPTQRAHTR